MNINEVIQIIEQEISAKGTQAELASLWGVTPQYLSDVIRKRRNPGPAILENLGIEKVISYQYTLPPDDERFTSCGDCEISLGGPDACQGCPIAVIQSIEHGYSQSANTAKNVRLYILKIS